MSQQLGSLLQQWRRDRQLSLGALAARAGLSKGTLSGWEQGRHQPRLPELDALFSALEATTHQQREALNLIRAPRAWQSLAALSSPASADLEAAAFPVPGHLLRALRLRRGLTLEAVAQLMGVDRSTVSRWERSLSTPSADRFPRLLDLLGARAGERPALGSGQNLPLPAAADRPWTMDEREQQLFTLERPVLHGDRRLLDLEFLAWQSEIWPQAARAAAARELLAMGWAFYAEWLTWDGRLREAGYCARRAID